MYYSRLSSLQGQIDSVLIESFDKYLSKSTIAELQNITVSRLMQALGIDPNTAIDLLCKCADNGLLERQYVICCPVCGLKLRRFKELSDAIDRSILCYSCENEFFITPENIEVQYRFASEPGFTEGQEIISASTVVAPADMLKAILEAENSINSLLFHPVESKYCDLLKMCKNVRKAKETTKKTGDTLENLTIELINCCSVLHASPIKTSTNQIDGFVRNKSFVPYGVLSRMGLHFVVECKNENQAPKGSYMSRIHSIIETINGKTNEVTFGMIVSKYAGPKTFRILANKYYLINGITIISISLKELEDMLKERGNFLEMIERKITEITLDATSDLREQGLYDA